jgi:hypothetical protein
MANITPANDRRNAFHISITPIMLINRLHTMNFPVLSQPARGNILVALRAHRANAMLAGLVLPILALRSFGYIDRDTLNLNRLTGEVCRELHGQPEQALEGAFVHVHLNLPS